VFHVKPTTCDLFRLRTLFCGANEFCESKAQRSEKHFRSSLTSDRAEKVINTSNSRSFSIEYASIRQADEIYCAE